MSPDDWGCGTMWCSASGMEWFCIAIPCDGQHHYFVRRKFDHDVVLTEVSEAIV